MSTPRRWQTVDGCHRVNEDRHASCQAMYKGVEGSEWDVMYFQYVEMHKAVNLKTPGGQQEGEGTVDIERSWRIMGRLL